MRVLVTGGAGYIGAHVVRQLQDRGDAVVVVDDMTTGVAERLPGTSIHRMDLADSSAVERLRELLVAERIEAVIHFAARKQVFESMERPAWYYQQNIGGLANLLLTLEGTPVVRFVFSSSAAVYGSVAGDAIAEDGPAMPLSPYGETKLYGEHLLVRVAQATGLRSASLRYFNVAGAGSESLGDRAVLNLVPMVFERLDAGEPPVIFGGDYDTADGTCVRDYVHVQDLASAHLAVLDTLTEEGVPHEVYNVGTGVGTSVREMVDEILRVSGKRITPRVVDRRPGDPASVVASADKIRQRIGWRASLGLAEIVESAWAAHVAQR